MLPLVTPATVLITPPLICRYIQWAKDRGVYVGPNEVEPSYLQGWVALPSDLVRCWKGGLYDG